MQDVLSEVYKSWLDRLDESAQLALGAGVKVAATSMVATTL